MTYWCIHLRRLEDGEVIKVQMMGPDEVMEIAVRVLHWLKKSGADSKFEVMYIHENKVDILDFFNAAPDTGSAVGNMILQGYTLVGLITLTMHYINQKKRQAE